MSSFEYFNPVRVIFGAGKLEEVGEQAAKIGKKVLLTSYERIDFLKPTLERVTSLLEDAGLEVTSFNKFQENPDISVVTEGANLCRSEGIDLVIAVGGGSVMDGSKAIAAGALYENGDLWNMVYARHDDVNAIPPEKALPSMMIPTLPATGSEMNMCAVVSNRDIKEKSYIWSECIFPKVSIIDPELTLTLPAYQSACAAADSISHVLEIYLNGADDTPLEHSFQEGVMRTVMDNIYKVKDEPNNLEARSHLCWAATCAINGWASPGDAWTPMHQVGHVLTSLHGVIHGASLTVLMASWMKSFSQRRPERYFAFATKVMDVNAQGKTQDEVIQEGILSFEHFLKEIGVPTSLSEVKVGKEDLPAIVEGVEKVSFGADGYLNCIPKVSKNDIFDVLNLAL